MSDHPVDAEDLQTQDREAVAAARERFAAAFDDLERAMKALALARGLTSVEVRIEMYPVSGRTPVAGKEDEFHVSMRSDDDTLLRVPGEDRRQAADTRLADAMRSLHALAHKDVRDRAARLARATRTLDGG